MAFDRYLRVKANRYATTVAFVLLVSAVSSAPVLAGCRTVGIWHKFTVCDPPTGGGNTTGGTRSRPTPAYTIDFNNAVAAWNRGDVFSAVRLAKQAAEQARRAGNKKIERRSLELIADGYLSLAGAAARRRDHAEARRHYHDAERFGLVLSRKFRDRTRVGKARHQLRVYAEADRLRATAARLHQARAEARRLARDAADLIDRRGTPSERLAWLLRAQQLILRAERLFATIPEVTLARRAGDPRPELPTCPGCRYALKRSALAVIAALNDLGYGMNHAAARARAAEAFTAFDRAMRFNALERSDINRARRRAEAAGIRKQFDHAWKAGNFDDAARLAAAQTRRNPRDIAAWRNLAIARERAGGGAAAVDAYRRLLTLESTPEAWAGLARTYLGDGRRREAENALRDGLARTPRDLHLNLELARLVADKGPAHSREAERILERTLASAPSTSASRETVARVRREHERLRDYNGSLRHRADLAMEGIRDSGVVAYIGKQVPDIALGEAGAAVSDAASDAWRGTVSVVERSRSYRLVRNFFGIEGSAPPQAVPAPADRPVTSSTRRADRQAGQAAGAGREAGREAVRIGPTLSPALDDAPERAAFSLQEIFDRASRRPVESGAAVKAPIGSAAGGGNRQGAAPPSRVASDPGWQRLERQAAAVREEMKAAERRRDDLQRRLDGARATPERQRIAVDLAAAKQAVINARSEQATVALQQDEYISFRAGVRDTTDGGEAAGTGKTAARDKGGRAD